MQVARIVCMRYHRRGLPTCGASTHPAKLMGQWQHSGEGAERRQPAHSNTDEQQTPPRRCGALPLQARSCRVQPASLSPRECYEGLSKCGGCTAGCKHPAACVVTFASSSPCTASARSTAVRSRPMRSNLAAAAATEGDRADCRCTHTHTHAHTRTHDARTHARTHAHTHTRARMRRAREIQGETSQPEKAPSGAHTAWPLQ